MRYWIALSIAVAIIVGASVFVWVTNRQFETLVRNAMRQQQQDGTLPPDLQGVDIATIDESNHAIKVPANQAFRFDLARALAILWYIWAPFVVLVCLGAALVGRFLRRGN